MDNVLVLDTTVHLHRVDLSLVAPVVVLGKR